MISEFQGEHRFLSNFWPAEVEFEGRKYPTVEHAYQAAKTEEEVKRRRIALALTPAEAKKLGRRLLPRPGWSKATGVEVMEDLLRKKFTHPQLRKRLLATENAELVEGNTWGDRFWGVCDGRGLNMLGKLLMKIRAECQSA